MSGPLLFSLLISLSVLIAFLAVSQLMGRRKDLVDARMEEYGLGAHAFRTIELDPGGTDRRKWSGMNLLLGKTGWGPGLATSLTRADLPLTAAEYTLVILGIGTLGFLLAFIVTSNILLGLLVGLLLSAIPVFYLRFRVGRRQKAFTEQIPEILTLLVGGLRAGYGLSQSMGIVVERMEAPASTEFSRVVRAVGFGQPIQQALKDMSARVGVDDLEMVVTAINVQYELGGNLAQTLDTIGETVRERLRIFREIKTMTAHQRFTGIVLAAEPVAIAVLLYMMNPEYVSKLFAPGWVRCMPIGAVVMVIIGSLIIRKICDIEV